MAGSQTVEEVVGTVIQGTLQPEDLLQAFTDKLAVLDPERASEIRKEYKDIFQRISDGWSIADGEYNLLMGAGECLHVLMDALTENAPEGFFFSSHPGDGSDFGFWPVEGVF